MKHAESDEQFLRGIEQFNRHEFFEAHETWEAIWLRATGQEKTFLQGLIQIAAAFHHYRRGKPAGTHSLLRAGLERLASFPPTYRGIRLAKFRRTVVDSLGSLARGCRPKLEELPKIEVVG